MRRSTGNTRARDFYDVYLLTKTQGDKLDRALFRDALNATIAHQESPVILTKYRETLEAILTNEGMPVGNDMPAYIPMRGILSFVRLLKYFWGF